MPGQRFRHPIAMKKALLLVLILIALAGLVYLNRERLFYYHFDQAQWAKFSSPQQAAKRYYMARYLIDRGLLAGKTPREISAMLGEPNVAAPNADAPKFILYDLGPERGSFFHIDDDWLEIQFDGKDEVESVRIRPD